MGYGKRALEQLISYYSGSIPSLNENDSDEDSKENNVEEDVDANLLKETVKPRKNLPPMLLKLSERRAEKLDYIGVSYGLTADLLRYTNMKNTFTFKVLISFCMICCFFITFFLFALIFYLNFFFHFCRFWKKSSFVPVYLRQSQVRNANKSHILI